MQGVINIVSTTTTTTTTTMGSGMTSSTIVLIAVFAGIGILFIPCAVCIYWRCKSAKERKEIAKLNSPKSSTGGSQESSSSGGRSDRKKRDNGPSIFFLKENP